MCRHRSRSDILWIIIWLISGPMMNVSLVLGNSLIRHWKPGRPAVPSWLGVLWRWISVRYYMRRASLGQAKFWRKGFNIGHIPLYLGSISDTILDISIVSCFFFCCCWCRYYRSHELLPFPFKCLCKVIYSYTNTPSYSFIDLEMITK